VGHGSVARRLLRWRFFVRRVQLAAPRIPFRSPSARPSGRRELTNDRPFTEVPRTRGAHVRNHQLEHVDDCAIDIDHFPLCFLTTVHEMKSKEVEEATKNAPFSA
jgi:hypothetical protein